MLTTTKSRERSRRRRRNRRRGAPRSLVVRRVIAGLLAACAAVLLLRTPYAGTADASAPAPERQLPPGIPLVLPLADPATASVLRAGEDVDLYVAHGEQPPTRLLTGVPLVEIQHDANYTGISDHNDSAVHIVVHISLNRAGVIESLLSASAIVATVSAVQSD